jgi:OOP family OmpA-OmpF porin
MRVRTVAAALAAALACSPAMAGDFYVGLSASDAFDDAADAGSGFDFDVDNGWSIRGGWNFAENWAVEVGWHDFGDFDCCGNVVADFAIDGESDGYTVAVMYAPRFDHFQPFGKLGWFHADLDGDGVSIAGPVELDDSDSGLTFELGARYWFNDVFALRGAYAWYDFDADSDGAFNLGFDVSF